MNINIVRALKGEFYRQSFNTEEHAQLAGSPVTELALTDDELGGVFAAGGHGDSCNQYDACSDNQYSQGGCYTHHHRHGCERPRFNQEWNNNYGSNGYNACHSFNSYRGNNDDYRSGGCQH